jgi:DHA1 family multidrug resistance protein-like MFS transporter
MFSNDESIYYMNSLNNNSPLPIHPFRLLCAVGFFAIFSSTMSKSPVLPLFAKELGASASVIGLIAAASTFTGIIAGLPAGVLSDLFGRRKVMIFAGSIFAVAPFLYLFVNDSWQLVVVRVFHGLATAVFGPVALAYVADLFESGRGEKMGWYSSSTLIGRSIAPFLGGGLLTIFATISFWHYRSVYLICGFAGVIMFIGTLILPAKRTLTQRNENHASLSERFSQTLNGLSAVIHHRGILVTSATEAVQYFGYGAYEVFLPLYAKSIGISDWMIGILLGVKVLTLTFTKPFMGRLSDATGRTGQIVVGMIAGALGLGLIPFFHSFFALIILSLFLGTSMAMVTSSTSALVADMSKGSYGSAMGVMSTIMDIGQASGPVIVGFLIAKSGYIWGYSFAAVLFLIASISFPLFIRGLERNVEEI